MSLAVHPVTLEVVRHALYAIAEEMSVILMRSARSPLLKEAGDLSSALTDAEGRLIAQGRDIPIHMGVMAFTVKEFLGRVPAERLRDGDVWFLNLPEVGGNHLPDVKALRPVFAGGRLIAFAINLAHWADIGGAVPGSYVPWATECYQEGVRIPPVRLFSADGPDAEKIDLLLANLRGGEERRGDMLAQFAADDVAARRIGELVERYGADTLTACFDALHAASEAGMRAALRALSDGATHVLALLTRTVPELRREQGRPPWVPVLDLLAPGLGAMTQDVRRHAPVLAVLDDAAHPARGSTHLLAVTPGRDLGVRGLTTDAALVERATVVGYGSMSALLGRAEAA